ncbi:MAG: CCA tRNA nucleotidyltransferase [Chitinophagales bacterium]
MDAGSIPQGVLMVIERLNAHGHPAFVVGGAVRDLLLQRSPKDWDVATAARPEEVLRLFPGARPTGLRYGTVTALDPELGGVEVTTFRTDGPYLDGRHPAAVTFAEGLEGDLARRDFTINALAYHPETGIIDHHGGLADLAHRRLDTVGDPASRFGEDALRMLRACRFAAELGFRPVKRVLAACRERAPLLGAVSSERQRDELTKLLVAPQARRGLQLLRVGGLLPVLLPELGDTYGLRQSHHHAYTVFSHTVRAVSLIAPVLPLRLVALFHDLGKVATRTEDASGAPLFPGHHRVSAEIAGRALRRLRFPGEVVERVVRLVERHMFHWTPAEGEAGLRRLLAEVGPDDLLALVALRRADLLAMRPLQPGDRRLTVLENLETAVSRVLAAAPPVRPTDLAVSGEDLMREFALPPGPAIGRLLKLLLAAVLDEPALNRRESLLDLARLSLGRVVADEAAGEVRGVVQSQKDGSAFPPSRHR